MRHVRFTATLASLLTAAAFVAYPAASPAIGRVRTRARPR